MRAEELKKEQNNMLKTDVYLPYRYNTEVLKEAICEKLPIAPREISEIRILKRELVVKDGGAPVYKSTVAFSADRLKETGLLKIRNKVFKYEEEVFSSPCVSIPHRPVVVGAGPAGLFAALALAESGAYPIIIERGLPVEERVKKIALFNTLGILDTESNVQFGEGGAGTYSDGKLKVGARDKYKLRVLREFVEAGADEIIEYSNTAHLGTDKLPGIVRYIREKIISLGGEFIFSAKLTDINIRDGSLKAITYDKDGESVTVDSDTVILATGHSARDTLTMLRERGLPMTAKGFGIGVRIEHPREYINKIVYRDAFDKIEETASYHLVTHLDNGRSVYSFCMCPGGTVVAATSEEGGIVTNGMSEYSRMADNSNAALLVSVTPEDFGSDDPLSGIEFQRAIEKRAYSLSSSYKAPAMRLADLLSEDRATELTDVTPSYPIGTVRASVDDYLPRFASESLRRAIDNFDAWLPGYRFGGAVLTGPETRTTSPVRIERTEAGYAVGAVGVYVAGEGAGYAGGIISSAVDGLRIAEKLIEKYRTTNR